MELSKEGQIFEDIPNSLKRLNEIMKEIVS